MPLYNVMLIEDLPGKIQRVSKTKFWSAARSLLFHIEYVSRSNRMGRILKAGKAEANDTRTKAVGIRNGTERCKIMNRSSRARKLYHT
jgi:hypothetical protein